MSYLGHAIVATAFPRWDGHTLPAGWTMAELTDLAARVLVQRLARLAGEAVERR